LVDPGKAYGHLTGIMNALRIGEYPKAALIVLVAGWR
jgi:hypothetical protein